MTLLRLGRSSVTLLHNPAPCSPATAVGIPDERAGEVRVYPMQSSSGEPYAKLAALRAALDSRGVDTELRATGCAYATTPGSDRMLVCRRSTPA